ncbi:hypothetical protein [Methanobrevibacter arboriphilus]|uniref:hypothetical protein n=1 Tax=Methanobrevibacter arboriphilus TaxID=39441 RepID=UPI000ABC8072|nr:hypothetical protein [Methanobrevibacter arboriphilus]
MAIIGIPVSFIVALATGLLLELSVLLLGSGGSGGFGGTGGIGSVANIVKP